MKLTWTIFGRETTNPLAIAFIIVFTAAVVPLTLPWHLLLRAVGTDGFLKNGSMYAPGAFWILWSIAAFVALLAVIL